MNMSQEGTAKCQKTQAQKIAFSILNLVPPKIVVNLDVNVVKNINHVLLLTFLCH